MHSATRWLPIIALLVGWSVIRAQEATVRTESRQADLSADWPFKRGPTTTARLAGQNRPPLSSTENVRWKSPIPGRGHGSPIVAGQRVFVMAAEPDREVQSVLCFDRATGRQLWQREVHQGAFETKGNAKASHASATCACDGERVFANFLNGGAIHATALSLEGEVLWRTKISDYVNHQGFGASPLICGPLVIFAADNKGGGAISALDRATGKEVWRRERPAKPNYASPILLRLADKEQVIFTGCDLVTSLDPLTGRALWEMDGSTTECVTSIVTDGERLFTSGGYPRNHVQAVLADGSGQTAWENGARVYVPSMIATGGHLYAVLDAGVAMCWKSDTGEEVWKGRVGGTFSSSLVLVDQHVFATDESGRTIVFAANSQEFKLLAENQLGSECFATPAICGSRIYHRYAQQEGGQRQEFLTCLGKPR
jgi:outer membrane protein assembly factor BamB